MSAKKKYLKPNVVLEPVVDKWCNWSYLTSPATVAMNVVGRHHMITESYLATPSIHADAVLYQKKRTTKLVRDMDGRHRLAGSDCENGMALVDIFNPQKIYVDANGQQPWCEFISSIKYTDESNPIVQFNKLVEICQERGIIAERLFREKELLYARQHALTDLE